MVRYASVLALLGDWAYTAVLDSTAGSTSPPARLSVLVLSAWAKRQVKEAVKAIDRFEGALADEAGARLRWRGVRPYPSRRDALVDGVLYLNDGDWVESCTALVEHMDGRLELIDWAALNRLCMLRTPAGEGGAMPRSGLMA